MSYTPQALKPNARKYETAPEQCEHLGLSMYVSQETALDAWNSLWDRFYAQGKGREEKVAKILGNQLNVLSITPAHGVFGDERADDGHITFHQYDGTDLASVSNVGCVAPRRP